MKQFFLLLTAMVCMQMAKAAPGDTTWVQAHQDMQLDHHGAFDVPVQFPDGTASYRKIIMTVTIGKYQCPGNPQYCGDWDYTVLNYLMTPNGDTLELGRLITPYANATYDRTPMSWRQRYEYDVTDFYPLLKDNAAIRLFYSGYSWGFTGDIKFAFVEGMPPRDVLAIERLWHGSKPYGRPGDPISNYLPPFNKTAPASAQSAEMKFTITGHGADDMGCSEFCKKYYQVSVDGNMIDQTDIWRDDCGSNHLYPQSGTWIYNRGNWCPGDLINPNVHRLGVAGGASYTLGLDVEAYTGSIANGGSWGSYSIESGVWYYGGFNRSNDASLEDIIAPSDHEVHFRENPRNGKPLITVKNTGGTDIKSLKIEYGIDGMNKHQYNWQGNIAPLDEQVIELPELRDLETFTGMGSFTVNLLESNGQADEDNLNNSLTSTFEAAPQWSHSFVVMLRTNNVPETGWKIFRTDNTVVAERMGTSATTSYNDTVHLGPGAYRLAVTDNGCDGLRWWANPGAGNGSLRIRSLNPFKFVDMNGYFGGDFGCGFVQYFNVNWPTAVNDVTAMAPSIIAFPNPATDQVNISLAGISKIDGTIQVIDAVGRVVLQQTCRQAEAVIHTGGLYNGLYTIVYSGTENKRYKTRIVIAR